MAFESFGMKMRNFSIEKRKAWAYKGINISISMQRDKPYAVRKLSISRAKICNFSRIGRKTKNNGFRKGKFG